LKTKTQFADIRRYSVGLLVEVAAICMIMLVAFAVGWLLMGWY
jgi:hypothetical protein